MHERILICDLSSASRTTLVKALAPRLNAVHFNGDDIRANINKDLGFTKEDRIEYRERIDGETSMADEPIRFSDGDAYEHMMRVWMGI